MYVSRHGYPVCRGLEQSCITLPWSRLLKIHLPPCAVARIKLVKPDKARGVEDILLNAAKRGQLGGKVCLEAALWIHNNIGTQSCCCT